MLLTYISCKLSHPQFDCLGNLMSMATRQGLRACMFIGSAREKRLGDRVSKFMISQMKKTGWTVDVVGMISYAKYYLVRSIRHNKVLLFSYSSITVVLSSVFFVQFKYFGVTGILLEIRAKF